MSRLDGLRRRARRVLRRGMPHPDRAVVLQGFDARFYRSAYPDVTAAGMDPVSHFLEYGWREGRNPSAAFSVLDYLDANPDVAAAGINPFTHYLRVGRDEGRPLVQDLGFRAEVVRKLVDVDLHVRTIQAAQARRRPDPPQRLASALSHARHGLSAPHITFSHDDFRTRVGGLQLCLQQEAAKIAALGRDHVHVHPVEPWPVVRAAGEPGLLEVLLNSEAVGAFAPETIRSALATAVRGAGSCAIHSLLGHDADQTAEILGAAGLTEGFFWLHDYASLCSGHNLLRNGVEDCGAPPPDSAACSVCVFGPTRRRHIEAHETLFRRLRLTVVAPAASTLDYWRSAWSFQPAGMVVHPHARLQPRTAERAASELGPLRVAFVGHPVAHKGWPVFRDLVRALKDDARYAFLHLGAQVGSGVEVEFHDVRIGPGRPLAMREALERHQVDVVVFWPLWRETFSFAVYEAIAAGCAVLTGPDSGNVAIVVRETGQGRVLADERELVALFETGAALTLARHVREPVLQDLVLSGMTTDLIGAPA